MGGRGATGLVYWLRAKKGSVLFCERIKGSTGGALRCIAIWGLSNCSRALRDRKPRL